MQQQESSFLLPSTKSRLVHSVVGLSPSQTESDNDSHIDKKEKKPKRVSISLMNPQTLASFSSAPSPDDDFISKRRVRVECCRKLVSSFDRIDGTPICPFHGKQSMGASRKGLARNFVKGNNLLFSYKALFVLGALLGLVGLVSFYNSSSSSSSVAVREGIVEEFLFPDVVEEIKDESPIPEPIMKENRAGLNDSLSPSSAVVFASLPVLTVSEILHLCPTHTESFCSCDGEVSHEKRECERKIAEEVKGQIATCQTEKSIQRRELVDRLELAIKDSNSYCNKRISEETERTRDEMNRNSEHEKMMSCKRSSLGYEKEAEEKDELKTSESFVVILSILLFLSFVFGVQKKIENLRLRNQSEKLCDRVNELLSLNQELDDRLLAIVQEQEEAEIMEGEEIGFDQIYTRDAIKEENDDILRPLSFPYTPLHLDEEEDDKRMLSSFPLLSGKANKDSSSLIINEDDNASLDSSTGKANKLFLATPLEFSQSEEDKENFRRVKSDGKSRKLKTVEIGGMKLTPGQAREVESVLKHLDRQQKGLSTSSSLSGLKKTKSSNLADRRKSSGFGSGSMLKSMFSNETENQSIQDEKKSRSASPILPRRRNSLNNISNNHTSNSSSGELLNDRSPLLPISLCK